MLGKYDSYRDSALHFLCSNGWENESFGDVSTYGVYLSRISNKLEEVHTLNTEINSLLEVWEQENPELLGTLECSLEEFRKRLVGHFLVSESDTGLVTVREFATEGMLISQYKAMEKHFNEFMEEEEEELEEEPGGMSRIQEENEYRFGDDRL
jgi:hypothetical protein